MEGEYLKNKKYVISKVREYMGALQADHPNVIRPMDRENLESILVDLSMIQDGTPELEYSITRSGNQYTVVARGFTEYIDLVALARNFMADDRASDKRGVHGLGNFPKSRGYGIEVNSIEPEEAAPRAKSRATSRTVY